MMYQGVVEDRNDPLQLGRVRVRFVGIHTEDKQKIATEDLPWAYPIQPITSAAMSGIGETPLGPVEGTWVVGYFRDEHFQQPVYFGTLAGIPQEESDPATGFNDPTGKYPLSDFIGEADTNRLARGEEAGTIAEAKKNNIDTLTTTTGGGQSEDRDEPETPYAAQYPFNHVKQTESGHIVEFDDTAGAERIQTYHKSGTFEEIHPDGTRVLKVVAKNYTAILGDNDIHIVGNASGQVEGGMNLLINGDVNLKVDGDMETKVGGDYKLDVSGKITLKAGPEIKANAGTINLN